MSIRKLSRTPKAVAGYEVMFCRTTIDEDCKFIADVANYGVELKYSCSMGQAKCMVYVDSAPVIRMIEKEFGV